jgi:anti-sigma B factor antagonist
LPDPRNCHPEKNIVIPSEARDLLSACAATASARQHEIRNRCLPHPLTYPAPHSNIPAKAERPKTRLQMTITIREVSHVTIVDIVGRITLGDETGQLRDTIRQLLVDGKKKIILNLAQVDYLDSSGVGELVSGYTAVRSAGGELKLLSLTKKVHDIVQVTKLYTVFDIKDDEFTAIKSFDYFFAK